MARLNLQGRLDFDGSRFKKGLDESKKKAQGFKDKIVGIGKSMRAAFAVGAIAAAGAGMAKAAKSAANYGDELNNLRLRTGLSVETLQKLETASGLAGATQEKLIKVFERLRRRQNEAINGNDRYAESFEKLGFSFQELQRLNAEELFDKLAKRLQDGQIEGRKMAEFMNVAGAEAGKAVPALKQLADLEGMTLLNQNEVDKLSSAAAQMTKLGDEAKRTQAKTVAATSGIGRFFRQMFQFRFPDDLGISRPSGAGLLRQNFTGQARSPGSRTNIGEAEDVVERDVGKRAKEDRRRRQRARDFVQFTENMLMSRAVGDIQQDIQKSGGPFDTKAASSLARVGLFQGPGISKEVRQNQGVEKQQLRELRQIREEIRRENLELNF